MSKQVARARGGYRPGSGRKVKATSGWAQVRVTVETRDALREQSREAGFTSIGDYVKALADRDGLRPRKPTKGSQVRASRALELYGEYRVCIPEGTLGVVKQSNVDGLDVDFGPFGLWWVADSDVSPV